MNRYAVALALVALSCARQPLHPMPVTQSPPDDLARWVNPLIGTSHGETWPGVDLPFGMLQWSPENSRGQQLRAARPGGYAYDALRIRGFSLTHMSGTGCAGAYGDIPFFPYPAAVTTSPSSDVSDAVYASSFRHERERAEAGYYRVQLDSGVDVELTATARTGAARFRYPAGAPATMLMRASNSEVGSEDAEVTVDPDARTVSGWVKSGNFCGYLDGKGIVNRRSYYTLHFVAEFDRPIVASGAWKDDAITPGATQSRGGTSYGDKGHPPAGKGSGLWITVDNGGGAQPVGVRVGISFVSAAGARANLRAENPAGTAFETVRAAARAAWNQKLARIEVAGGSDDQRTTFYTALYHALLHPNLFSDVDGAYVGMDQKVHRVAGRQRAQYANFSGWDVYRGQLQLVTLLEPAIASDIAQSLYNQAEHNGGVWDRWTHAAGGTHVMTGDPAHAALASIYAFGGTGFDAERALASMVRAATEVTAADRSREGWAVAVTGERPSLDQYLTLHYVPADGNAWGGAGETLEDVAADFGLAQLARRLGQRAVHDTFLRRSGYWRNVFNPAATAGGGYVQERFADGRWKQPFDPAGDEGFAEGSSAQYTWMVPFDVRGLFAAMGGSARAVARLDAFFHKPDGSWALSHAGGEHAEMDNEPSIGAAFLYSFAGLPWQTQATVRQVLTGMWRNAPDGIPGQDDLGAMSSWYAWAAIGLYPQYPGRAELLLVAPLFERVIVHRGNGVTLTIAAPGARPAAGYIAGLTFDGAASTRPWLPESFVSAGGRLDVTLATAPERTWGAAAADAPPSFAPIN